MKFRLKINGSESDMAAYVGWTPVKCTLTVDSYDGQAPMPVSITTGNYGKSGRLSLYESNATSAMPVEKIVHDFETQAEFSFYIAGEYPNASKGEKDTFILVESKTNEVPTLSTKVMIRVRKNANKLSPKETEDFLNSFVRLNSLPPKETYSNDPYAVKPGSLLGEIVLMHTYDAMFEIHMRTSFHPWHRVFLLHLEREMQEEFPQVTIPYWKFDEGAGNVFTTGFIGETIYDLSGSKRPKFDKLNPLYTYIDHTAWGPMSRTYVESDPATGKPRKSIYTESQIIDVSQSLREFENWSKHEERNSHNQAHNSFGGQLSDIGRDPIDPLFFMMHSNVDRLWALWQEKYDRFDSSATETYPFQEKYRGERGEAWANANPGKLDELGFYRVDNSDLGNYLGDTLWPWNLDHDLSRPMRMWTDEGKRNLVPQINIKFPNSVSSEYPGGPLTVKSTIDYQNRSLKGPHMGFDYDNLPYFEHDRKTTTEKAMASATSDDKTLPDGEIKKSAAATDSPFVKNADKQPELLEMLVNNDVDDATKLNSATLADETTESFLDTALSIIADPAQSSELRSILIHKVAAAKRSNLFFSSRKPRFFEILRGLLTNENQQLRLQAIGLLAAGEDVVVQEFLVRELQKDNSEFISKKDAIFFLRQNTKPQHAALFRKIFEESNDLEVRKAAIEGLGNDPDAIGLLKNLVLNPDENFKVREAGALSLHHLDHEAMNELAAQIIAQPESGEGIKLFRRFNPDPDEVDFKAGLLNMLTFTGDVNSLKQNEELKTSLKEVVAPGTVNKMKFLSSFESFTAEPSAGPTTIEQMASKLLNRLEANENE